MSLRHRMQRLERRLGPRTFPDFVITIEEQNSTAVRVRTITFDGYMNATTTEVWREGAR